MARCAMCGTQVDESQLLFSDAGRVCGACELKLGEREAEENTGWATAVGGPLIAFTALICVLAFWVPVIGLVTGAIAPFLSIVAVGLGVNAFLASGDTEPPLRTLLVVCGALAVPSGLGLFVISVLLLGIQILRLAGPGY